MRNGPARGEPVERRVLVIAYYFPPLGGMGSVRAVRFVRLLPELGWRPVVITPTNGMYHRPPGEWTMPVGLDVIRTRSLELSRLFRGAYRLTGGDDTAPAGTLEPLRAGRIAAGLRGALREIVYIPDAQIGWLPFAARAAAAAVRQHAPDVVYTSSVPFTSHLVGRLLQRRHGVPWVAEFRDLWTGSQAGQARTAFRRAINRRLQSAIVEHADAVVVTTPAARSLLAEACPRADPDRIHVVTNAFDASEHPAPRPPGPEEPLVLVHAGTILPGLQDPAPLLTAAGRLERRTAGSVRVRVFGPAEPWRDALHRSGAPEQVLELRGLVSPTRIPVELSQASAVLLLAPGPTFRAVYLGKMIEWLGSGLPALAVMDPDGVMAEVVRRSGSGIVAALNDPTLLATILDRMLAQHRRGELASVTSDPTVRQGFEALTVTATLAGVFESARRFRQR
jgi:glycosyltransferase involved in cell wall biosynthesis